MKNILFTRYAIICRYTFTVVFTICISISHGQHPLLHHGQLKKHDKWKKNDFNCDSCIDLTCPDTCERRALHYLQGDADAISTLKDRAIALDFYKTLAWISEPSTLSILSDYKYNTRKRLLKRPYVLEADVQMPIAIGGKQWRLNSLHVIPQFKVRILQDDKAAGDSSLPVRTPSYLPALIYYFSFKPLFHANKFHYFGFKAFHHSNGQDGWELNPVDSSVNFHNGNFSENAVFEIMAGGVYRKKIAVDKHCFENCADSAVLRTWHWKLGYEYHPEMLTNRVFNRYHMYGKYRVNFQLGAIFTPTYNEYIVNHKNRKCYKVARCLQKEMFRLVFNLSYIVDDIYYNGITVAQLKKVEYSNIAKRVNTNLTLHWIIPGSVNGSAFIQAGWYGSDPYNIYFSQSFFQLRGGLSFALYRYPRSGDFSSPVYNLF